LKLEATKYEIKSKIIEMVAANPFEGMVTENPCVKKEFPMNGSNGISFPTHLPGMQRHGTRLRPLKLKAIGTN
jgi:hypothetical protein